jgi:hypothetical protein
MSEEILQGEVVNTETGLIKPKPLVTLSRSIMNTEESALGDWFMAMVDKWATMPDDIKDAVMLIQRRFAGSGGGFYYLSPPQALRVVRFCREKGLEVHSDHWFFDPKNDRINESVSGLRAEAKHKNINLGPPVLERLTRQWPSATPRIKGYEDEDFGYKCKMRVGEKEDFATYEAWFSTSAQTQFAKPGETRFLKSGPWNDNPDHMCQIASQRNCIKNALGAGISQLPADDDDALGAKV